MESIWITDVSPRDGLQNQAKLLSTGDKLALIGLLVAAGLRRVEVTSFVSPKAVPQMADAADLLSLVIEQFPQLQSTVLVPNPRGLERARLAGAGEISVVLAATETMNRKNINQGLADATRNCQDTVRAAKAMGMRTRAYLAVAFDCPFEGVTPVLTLMALAEETQDAQADDIVIAEAHQHRCTAPDSRASGHSNYPAPYCCFGCRAANTGTCRVGIKSVQATDSCGANHLCAAANRAAHQKCRLPAK